MNYEEMRSLPRLNNVTIIGNKRLEDFGLIPMTVDDVNEIVLEVFGYIL